MKGARERKQGDPGCESDSYWDDRRMRTIGLLGGMSWESSAEYYRIVNEQVRDRLGGLHSARCLLYSVDFAEIEALQTAGDWTTAATVLLAAGRALQAGGAELLVLCTNTMHKVAGELERGLDIPLLHLADTTAVAVKAAGVHRVGLLGTAFTMEQAFYTDRLTGRGLDVLVPEDEDRALVHRVIYDELVRGLLNDESRAAFRRVIGRLVARGAQGVILGCTEIELLVGPADSPVPLFPTTRLHAEAAVTAALDLPIS
jgi:aspartate racemase